MNVAIKSVTLSFAMIIFLFHCSNHLSTTPITKMDHAIMRHNALTRSKGIEVFNSGFWSSDVKDKMYALVYVLSVKK